MYPYINCNDYLGTSQTSVIQSPVNVPFGRFVGHWQKNDAKMRTSALSQHADLISCEPRNDVCSALGDTGDALAFAQMLE